MIEKHCKTKMMGCLEYALRNQKTGYLRKLTIFHISLNLTKQHNKYNCLNSCFEYDKKESIGQAQ